MAKISAYNWAGMPVQDLPGIAFGYSTHSKMLRKYMELEGVSHNPRSPIAVSILSANLFRPIVGSYNILFTMYEAEDIPPDWVEPLNMADLIVVPCYQNLLLFRKYTDKPIEVCWEGTETGLFSYAERKFPEGEDRFRYLWVGAPNPRKGWEFLSAAYDKLRVDHPELDKKIQLYMKTTNIGEKGSYQMFGDGQIIVDKRVLSRSDLAKLYQESHCFASPAQGEGFSLCVCESLSTGCPTIHVPYGGTADFADYDISYPIQWQFKNTETFHMGEGALVKDLDTKVADPSVEDLSQTMYEIYCNYDEALAKGRMASERMKDQFDWKHSAHRFKELVEHHYFRTHPGEKTVDFAPMVEVKKPHPSILTVPPDTSGCDLLLLPTMRCNLQCSYCDLRHGIIGDSKKDTPYTWKYFGIDHRVDSEVGAPEVLSVIRKLRPRNVEITGGEPLLWLSFTELINSLPKEVTWSVTSNSILVTDEFIEKTDLSRCISWTASDHNNSGVLVQKIAKLIEKVPLSVSVVADHNWTDLSVLDHLWDIYFKGMGARVNVLIERAKGVSWKGRSLYFEIESFCSQEGLLFVPTSMDYTFPSGFECKGGKSYFAMSPDGVMYRCFSELMLNQNSLGSWDDFAVFSADTLCSGHVCFECSLDSRAHVARYTDLQTRISENPEGSLVVQSP